MLLGASPGVAALPGPSGISTGVSSERESEYESDGSLDLDSPDFQKTPRFSLLNTFGPFVLLNPVGIVDPGAKCHLLIAFVPEEDKTFFENLEVRTRRATLTLGIKGRGLAPYLSCSLDTKILNMGYVLAKDSATSIFKLHNMSTVPVNYSIKLGSLSMTHYEEMQKLPNFISSQKSLASLVALDHVVHIEEIPSSQVVLPLSSSALSLSEPYTVT
ncbi:unnamed protein product [Ranitomeya imitator]|uniref:Uncharacterized protein n=1 Tax=Ranitomeya imitator TaxID=111125 RepID=A0ABN9M5T8_9NEOB|nr:unnamed protein product [Ranitomeya imitator]